MRRSRAPELDPFHQKNEDDKAKRTAASIGPGEAPVDGDVAGAAAKTRAWRRLGLGLLHGEEKEGREKRAEGSGGPLIDAGGPQRGSRGRAASATARPWRQ